MKVTGLGADDKSPDQFLLSLYLSLGGLTGAAMSSCDVIGSEILTKFIEKAVKEASLIPPNADEANIPTVCQVQS